MIRAALSFLFKQTHTKRIQTLKFDQASKLAAEGNKEEALNLYKEIVAEDPNCKAARARIGKLQNEDKIDNQALAIKK